MAKIDRTGIRKNREQSRKLKIPELGYYLIVTDTEATERCFFTGLHQSLKAGVRNKLVIKVIETKTRIMIDKCLELTAYDAQYRVPWIVFDRDVSLYNGTRVGGRDKIKIVNYLNRIYSFNLNDYCILN